MKSIFQELRDINKIISQVGMMAKVQKEASSVSRTATVTDGKHEDVNFDVVVRCASSDMENIRRRLATLEGLEIEKIAENILGVRNRHGK